MKTTKKTTTNKARKSKIAAPTPIATHPAGVSTPSRTRVLGSPRTVMSARVDTDLAMEMFRICEVSGHINISETVAAAIFYYVQAHKAV